MKFLVTPLNLPGLVTIFKRNRTGDKATMARVERVNVQRTLAFVGFFYFIYSAGKACLFPFLTIYLRQLGLTATQTGIILGLKPFAALLAAPLWIRCAIMHNKRRVILMTAILTMIGGNLGLTLIPPVAKDESFKFCNPKLSNFTDGNSDHYAISPIIDKIGQYVFHSHTEETSTARDSLNSSHSSISSASSSSSKDPDVPPQMVTPRDASDSKVPRTIIMVTSRALPPTVSKVPSLKKSNDVPTSDKKESTDFNGAQYQPHKTYSVDSDDNFNSNGAFSDNDWSTSKHAPDSHFNKVNDNSARGNSVSENSKTDNSNVIMDDERYKQALEYLKEQLLSKFEEDNDKTDGETSPDKYQGSNYRAKRHGGEPEYWNLLNNVGTTTEKVKTEPAKVVTEKAETKPDTGEKQESSGSVQTENEAQKGKVETDQRDTENKNSSGLLESARNEASMLKEEFLQLEYVTFMTALVIVVLGEILASPADKICDDSLYETLDQIDEVDKYGRHHVVSLIGMGVAAVGVTVAVHFSNCLIFLDASRIMIHFYAFAVLCGVAFLLAFCYPMQDPGKNLRYEKLFRGLVLLLTEFHNIMVVVTLLLVGFLSASVQNFMFWSIQDLKGSEIVMGLTVAVAAIAEMPMLFSSGILTKKLGHMGVLGLAVITLSARLLYFSYLWTPWAAVPIELLNMFCKGALWESAMMYAEHTAPPGMARTMQVVMVVLYYGIGSSNGSVISGIIYDHFGKQVMFLTFAIIALFWAVVLIIVAKFIPKRRKLHYSKILRDDDDNNNEDDDIFDSSDDGDDWLVNALKKDKF